MSLDQPEMMMSARACIWTSISKASWRHLWTKLHVLKVYLPRCVLDVVRSKLLCGMCMLGNPFLCLILSKYLSLLTCVWSLLVYVPCGVCGWWWWFCLNLWSQGTLLRCHLPCGGMWVSWPRIFFHLCCYDALCSLLVGSPLFLLWEPCTFHVVLEEHWGWVWFCIFWHTANLSKESRNICLR